MIPNTPFTVAEYPTETEAVMAGQRTLKELADGFLQKYQAASPADFVRRAYEVFLGRPADAARGNGRLLYEVNNRGRKLLFSNLCAGAQGNDLKTSADFGDALPLLVTTGIGYLAFVLVPTVFMALMLTTRPLASLGLRTPSLNALLLGAVLFGG